MRELLKVENLSVTFSAYNGEIHAVRDVSFSVHEGETLAVAGESGCGKSVTVRAILRLLERTSAKVSPASVAEYQGNNLLMLPKKELNKIRGNEISMVFQDAMASLNPTMTIGNQLIETVRAHRATGKTEAAGRASELLRLVELPDPASLFKRFPHELSGGQRQRVMIAMALSNHPKILIADEPTTALDVTVQAQILELLQRLQKQLGMSVLFITHDLGLVAGIADRVQIMYGGRIVERGTAEDIFTAPKHPYTAALLAAVPRRNMERRKPLSVLPGTPPDLRLTLDCCPFAARCSYAMAVCKRKCPPEVKGCRCWLMHELAPKVSQMGVKKNE